MRQDMNYVRFGKKSLCYGTGATGFSKAPMKLWQPKHLNPAITAGFKKGDAFPLTISVSSLRRIRLSSARGDASDIETGNRREIFPSERSSDLAEIRDLRPVSA
jgi:hypothetical protein